MDENPYVPNDADIINSLRHQIAALQNPALIAAYQDYIKKLEAKEADTDGLARRERQGHKRCSREGDTTTPTSP